MPATLLRVLLMACACVTLVLIPACSDDEETVVSPDVSDEVDVGDTSAMETSSDATPDLTEDDMDMGDALDGADHDMMMAPADVLDLEDMPDDEGMRDVCCEDFVDMVEVEDTPDTIDMMMPNVPPLPGFGAITGMCDVLDSELTDANPHVFVNTIDFGTDPYDMTDLMLLTMGGQEIIADGNAGGSSLFSEVFAFEMLARCELAVLLKTETEVVYTTQGKITDLLVEIDGTKIGVSVTRAVGFPRDDPYTVAQAQTLLEDKLSDVLESSANVAPEDAWSKQILHVIAYAPMHAQSLQTAFSMIDPMITADTILMVTVSEGDDGFLY